MLPVACLPVCGILMGVGYILAPAAMAGEVAGFTAGGVAYTIGLFLIKAGGATAVSIFITVISACVENNENRVLQKINIRHFSLLIIRIAAGSRIIKTL